jgi:hypothetical protein
VQPQLKVLGNRVDPVEIVVARRPARRHQVHPPPAFTRAQELLGMAQQRCALPQVVAEGINLMPVRGMSAGFKDPPPGRGAAVVAHHTANLPWTAGTKQFGHISVGQSSPGWNQLNHRQNRLDVLNPHGSSVAAVALPDLVGAGR